MRKILLSAAALSMVAGTSVAQAAPVDARAAANVEGESLDGISILPLLLGLAAIIGAIFVIADDDDDTTIPVSV
ncbi:hypothetical protein VCJ71_06345 [Alteriqipengyuania sp. WL0013]|nr:MULTISPECIES: hypothetical protein [Alteriqipengyuania]MEB3415681.1 hypothetical protein [Alteriqipengyuania sp. WL0013]WJY18974.1 hypothetical protein QQW98_01620 [Alteriqipengyuania flavescens]WJY24914.1 hypothetical protein QQS45_01620 [Alteriqipengyuania flavescens]